MERNLTAARLRQVIAYDPETGIFMRLPRKGKGGLRAPKLTGSTKASGYCVIQVDGVIYAAGRLAVLYMTDTWPTHQVDHIDNDPSNNRWKNLRPATQTQNKANSRAYKNNKLGVKGVRLHSNGQYEARLRIGGILQYLGCYRTMEEAKQVYDQAAERHFGAFSRSV